MWQTLKREGKEKIGCSRIQRAYKGGQSKETREESHFWQKNMVNERILKETKQNKMVVICKKGTTLKKRGQITF